MPGGPIFISHATADDAFVSDLRQALESLNHAVWVDSRNLRGGDVLAAEIAAAIRAASSVIVVLSTQTVNSPWVRKEIDMALVVQDEQGADYRVLPLLLPGMRPAALGMWFAREPLAVPVELTPGKLAEALPAVLAGLGLRLPEDKETLQQIAPQPVDELILELRDPTFATSKGVRRAKATATLVYQPASPDQRAVESRRYTVTAPLGPIELEEIRWYLEEFYLWPVGVFKERAERTAAALPGWGRDLYGAAVGAPAAQEALNAWRASKNHRRFSVWVDSDPPDGASAKRQDEAAEAASQWLSLPWELLRDDGGYLLHGARPVPVRRRLPNRKPQPVRLAQPPVRILLLSPRPELDEAGKNSVGYIDHRASALPLVAAVENLGELARVTVLTPPTLPALEAELARAQAAGEGYDVVHFDGHGVYDKRVGLGALLFEHPADAQKLGQRRMQLVHAERLASIMRDHGIPLVFLEACQTAQVEADPTASVAARLLSEGVSSVVAMRASVLVETSRRFVEAFYAALARGETVGEAAQAGQRALEADSERGKVMGAGALHLHDWFVPVLYQEERDPPLFNLLPGRQAQQLQTRQRSLALGDLPETPPHQFVGRSRELLRLERLLAQQPYAVVRGTGGAGKTTLAAELARWLSRSGRFRRAAFASLEHIHDARGLLDSLGHQLLPNGGQYSVAEHPTLDKALQPVERALRDHPTVIVIDNVETVFGEPYSVNGNPSEDTDYRSPDTDHRLPVTDHPFAAMAD
ncbi:MAG: CHAT domain-containing protein, partial [Anaerolineae bacterium]|nr:CHAT domain-containing protein [Anaerolineae bacterium]